MGNNAMFLEALRVIRRKLSMATVGMLIGFLMCGPSFAATYYVAKNGSDADPGTIDKPWRSIGKAARTLMAGDGVMIRGGVYRERVNVKNSGTPGNYISFEAYPGESVTINGKGLRVPRWTGLFNIAGKEYIQVSGLRVLNSMRVGILADTSRHIVIKDNFTYNTVESGIAAWGCFDVLMEGNEVVLACNNGQGECITVCTTESFQVRFNHVHHGGPGRIGGEGICAKDGSSNGQVYGNHVHHVNRVGIYVDAWDKHTFNIEVFDNNVHNCATDGMALASEMGGLLEGVRVTNNILYRNKYVGIVLANWGGEGVQTHPLKDIAIVNNTFYRNGNDWGGGISIDSPAISNVVVRNNIVSKNLSFQMIVDPTVPAGECSVDHNLIDGYRGYEGEIYGTDYVEGNPLFAEPAKGNFHLLQGSRAIDSGSPREAPEKDYEGVNRPQGEGYDIGAFEVALL
jgi:hypothetical protein